MNELSKRLTPLTILLILLALGLLSLALWSFRISLWVDAASMQIKGGLIMLYAGLLAAFALYRADRPQSQRVMLVGILVILALGEVVARLLNPTPEDPDYRSPAPYVMFAPEPNADIEAEGITLSPLGYRDVPPLPKPADEYRVLLLGGSTVFNGSPREVSIAGALEASLNANHPAQVQVYNWGVYSAVSGQELTAILFEGVDYAPDLIVVYDGSNDLTLPYFFDPRPGYPFDFMATEGGRRLIAGDWGLYDLYAVLLRPSALGYALFQSEIEEQITRRGYLARDAGEGSEVWRQAIVDEYAANLGKMCVLARAYGSQFVAILQPMIFFKDRLVGDEPNWLGTASYQAHTLAMYDLARTAFNRLARQHPSCTFTDGSTLLQNERAELFVDPVHLRDEGRVLVGRRLAALLTPTID